MRQYYIYAVLLLFFTLQLTPIEAKDSAFQIGRLKYEGGGDWYNDPSSEVNLLDFINKHTNIEVSPQYVPVDINTTDIFKFPFLFVTGHGSMNLTENHIRSLRLYLEAGGFIYIDDDYGMDKYVRPILDNLIPGSKLEAIPLTHPIYSSHFDFPRGIPKVHEHDDKAPEVLGLYVNDRLSLLYTVESNPSDGWADEKIHNTPSDKREAALKFGANIIVYALTH